eukprot:scaffold229497_cov19-Tisochrysis_lutea.AAC.3
MSTVAAILHSQRNIMPGELCQEELWRIHSSLHTLLSTTPTITWGKDPNVLAPFAYPPVRSAGARNHHLEQECRCKDEGIMIRSDLTMLYKFLAVMGEE